MSHRRRLGVLAWGVLHLLQATWILHAGVDALLPAADAVAVAVSADACCARACGCPEEVRARKACCCLPTADAPAPARTSAFEIQRCRGVDAALAQAASQPALETFARLDLAPLRGEFFELPWFEPEFLLLAADLDKVPLL